MTDEHSKGKNDQDLADHQFDEEVLADAGEHGVDLDHLQDDFNVLISDPTPDEEATDAFNDLADAFSAEVTPSTPVDHDKDFSARLDESFNEFEASSRIVSDSGVSDVSSIPDLPSAMAKDEFPDEGLALPAHLDDRSDEQRFDAPTDTSTGAPIEEPFAEAFETESPDTVSRQGSNAMPEQGAPAYADLSGNDDTEARPKSHLIALVSALLLTTAGVVYWYNTDSTDKSAQVAALSTVSTQVSVEDAAKHAKAIPKATSIVQVPSIEAAYTGGWVIVAPVASTQLARQYVTDFKAKHINSEALRMKENGKMKNYIRIKGFTSERGAKKRSERLAKSLGLKHVKVYKATTTLMGMDAVPKINKTHKAKLKSPVKKLAVIQPSTPIKKATANRNASGWMIVAPVDSKRVAQQYVADFKAKNINSEAFRISDNGKMKNYIRINGFTSERGAKKRRDRLAKSLGLQGAKVLKATVALTPVKRISRKRVTRKQVLSNVFTNKTALSGSVTQIFELD